MAIFMHFYGDLKNGTKIGLRTFGKIRTTTTSFKISYLDVKDMIAKTVRKPEWHNGVLIMLEPINIESVDAAIGVYGDRSMPTAMDENWAYSDGGKRFSVVMSDVKHCVVETTGKVGWKWAAYTEYYSANELGTKSRIISGCKLSDIPSDHPMYAKVQQLVGMGLTEREATRSVFDYPRCVKASGTPRM